jgi:phage terminase large subunit GpA-like protein
VQAVKNTVFGELFLLQGEAPAPTRLAELRGAYKLDDVPTGAHVLTCGVDVQKDRLVYALRGWGDGATSWLIRHAELFGDTDQQAVWLELAELLAREWGGKRVRLMLIDSGFRPDAVYAFARRFPGRVLPSKGHDEQAKPVLVTRLEVNARGKTSRTGVALAHIDSSYFKAYVHGRIAWPIDQPGAWHIACDTTDDYCEQLLAESRVTKPTGRVIWVRSRKANHYLDCEALNAAAAHLLNLHLVRRPKAAQAESPRQEPAQDPFRTMKKQWRPDRPGTRRGWATRWR